MLAFSTGLSFVGISLQLASFGYHHVTHQCLPSPQQGPRTRQTCWAGNFPSGVDYADA